MNRAKIWGLTLFALALGVMSLYVVTRRASEQAMEQVGLSLRAGVAQFDTASRLLARQVKDVAVLAARDPELLAALSSPAIDSRAPKPGRRGAAPPPAAPVDVAGAAEKALKAAGQSLDVDLSHPPLFAVASEKEISFRIGDRPLSGKEAVVQAVLGGPAGGRHVRIEDTIYYVFSATVGPGATIAFGLPLEPRWPERLKAATGADMTLLSGAKLPSTLPTAEAAATLAAVKKNPGATVDGAPLRSLKPPGLPLPAMPLLFARVPSFRARTLTLPGLDGPAAVLSVPTRAFFEPVALFQELSLLALAVLFFAGLALGLIPEQVMTAHVPRELASAADRIARGDFEARVPRMSGTFGTLAAALNRAADAARAARAVPPSASLPPTGVAIPPAPAHTLDVPMMAVPPPELASLSLPPEPVSPLAVPPDLPGPASFAEALPPSPTPEPAAPAFASSFPPNGPAVAQQTPLSFSPPPAPRTGTARFEAAEPLAPQMPAPPGPPPPAPVPLESDEAAWQRIYQEFLKVREECGESLEGLTWERFRQKLKKNRDSLVEKYACRTVRFQVYVKEGKAALKATPVR